MLSPSPSDRRSSTRRPAARPIQVAALVLLAVLAIAFAGGTDTPALLAAAAVALLGALVCVRIARDAQELAEGAEWQRRMRGEMVSQSAFLDALVSSLENVSSSLDATRVLEQATAEAHKLFAPEATVLLTPAPGDGVLRPMSARGLALGPISGLGVHPGSGSLLARVASTRRLAAGAPDDEAARGDELTSRLRPLAVLAVPLVVVGELHAVLVLLELRTRRTFEPAEVARVAVFADFAARAVENAHLFERVEALLAQARIRESERAALARRVVSAEQDERRRLSLFLHDGPLQTMSGIAMMLDAVAEETAAGRADLAGEILHTAQQRQRGLVRSMRELSFALEPWVLRDQGFATAARALADEFERNHSVRIELEVDAAEALPPDDQVYLYQIAREAVQNAVRHGSPERVSVELTGRPGDGFELLVADDGIGLGDPPDDGLPHHGIASMRERAALLNGRFAIDSVPGQGTTVRVTIPPSVQHADAR